LCNLLKISGPTGEISALLLQAGLPGLLNEVKKVRTMPYVPPNRKLADFD
jgi:hypothetical protein